MNLPDPNQMTEVEGHLEKLLALACAEGAGYLPELPDACLREFQEKTLKRPHIIDHLPYGSPAAVLNSLSGSARIDNCVLSDLSIVNKVRVKSGATGEIIGI